MNNEEHGKAAYEAARKMHYRLVKPWQELTEKEKDYWTAIAKAVLESAKLD